MHADVRTRRADATPDYDVAEPSHWAAKNVGGTLLCAAAILVSGITALTDLRGEPYPPTTRLLNYALSGCAAALGLLLARMRRRAPLWLINVLPSVAAMMVCVPTAVDRSPSPLGPLLLTWPVTFAAAVLTARVAWVTFGVTAAAFAVLAAISRGVDGLTLWVEATASIAAVCWMVARLRGQSLRLRRALAELARTDPLTGLLNRRGFDEALEREHSRQRRGGPAMALLLVDIDHFKAVNDSRGHQAGDSVLRELGALMSTRFRGMDVVGRIGGEEFAVLIPGCTMERGYQRAVELCDAVRTGTITWDPPITVSVGVCTSAGAAPAPAELFAAADAALYAAKDAGRDRVGRADPPRVRGPRQ
jgi:diguanylate cyclase (GGDEF)-like protein